MSTLTLLELPNMPSAKLLNYGQIFIHFIPLLANLPSLISWIKLNADGSMVNSILGTGSCLRDDHGNWIIGLAKHVGNDSVLQAELWAIFLGLNIALQINKNLNIEIETDSSQSVYLLSDYSNGFHPLDPFIVNCRYILSKLSNYKIEKVARQQNTCVDALAKEGCLKRLPFTLFNEIPKIFLHIHQVDVASLSTNATSSSNLLTIASSRPLLACWPHLVR